MLKNSNILNEMQLVLPAISQNESVSRAMIGAFVAQLNPTLEELADLKCVLSEAVTNGIIHAYRHLTGEARGNLYIRVSCYRDRRVKIVVRDTGCGIPDIKAAREPLFTTDPENERSGMGFAVMENFTDKMSVSSKVGCGTKVTLWKQLKN